MMRRLFGPSCALLTLPYKGKGKRKRNHKLFYPANKLPLPLYRKRFIRGCGSQAVMICHSETLDLLSEFTERIKMEERKIFFFKKRLFFRFC